MPNKTRTSPSIAALAGLAHQLAQARTPQEVCLACDHHVKAQIGHKLFTIMLALPGGAEVERIYSSNEAAYPLTGRKPRTPSAWTDHVIGAMKTWYGRDINAINAAFPDGALIASLGCGCCLNVPIAAFGEVIGTMNILDRENAYSETDIAFVEAMAPALYPALLKAAA